MLEGNAVCVPRPNWERHVKNAESQWERHVKNVESQWERLVKNAEPQWERHVKNAESQWERHVKIVESQWERLVKIAEPQWERLVKIAESQWERQLSEACSVRDTLLRDHSRAVRAGRGIRRKANAGAGTGPSAADIAGPYTAGSVPPLQRTLAVNTSGEVVLEGPSKSTSTPEGVAEGPYDSRRRLRELIGAPSSRIPDEQLRDVPFYPVMGAQAVKKYFTPKWEEFSSHGSVEDVLEASLASAIRASTLQMKVLGEFRTRMQEQRKLAAQASRANKEHEQAMEGLKMALESARAAYEQLEADLKESDSNLLNMTKQLDNANAAQKVAAEALETANNDKRRLLEEAKSREEEMSGLRAELAKSEKGRKEAEDGKKEVEARLADAEADFVANFHNTEAYTNFADYFARVGHQEVLTVLRNDHPEFNVKNLEVRFPPPDAEGEEDS
ncbi:Uncharacterized protein Adt_49275 [Abeliophyllum distichum]|uniref:Uncharacterized protein n=1 Tax=Abeliophyllum distichum TaxID=126358 RepID=A0ABD1NNP9_9LAMI